MGASDIKVTPSALGTAAATVRGVGERVRESSVPLVGAAGSGAMVGDAACGQGLAAAERLVGLTLLASAAGLLELSRALNAAADTYSLAEASAVPGASRP